jgi:spermidine synthase
MINSRHTIFYFTALAMLLLFLAPAASGVETVIYEYDSVYHHIRVTQDGSIRGLRFDNNHFQSLMDVNRPYSGHFQYIDLLFMPYLFNPDIKDVLMLGLGGGSAQKLFHYLQPELNILTVELDPAVVDVAEEFFFYDRDELPVAVSDARMYLSRNSEKYDLIIQDTYSSNIYGTFIPFHLATLEYFTLVRDRLTDDGVFAVNVVGTVYGGEPNRVITSVYRTMHEVFPQLYLFAAEDVQNVVIVATTDQERLTRSEMQARAQALLMNRRVEFLPGFLGDVSDFYDTAPSGLASAIVLTDDYAPTDNLLR